MLAGERPIADFGAIKVLNQTGKLQFCGLASILAMDPQGKNAPASFPAEMCEMLASGQLHDAEVRFGLLKGAPEMLASPPIQTLRFLPAFFE